MTYLRRRLWYADKDGQHWLDQDDLLGRLKEAADLAHSLDWRLHDVNVVPVSSIE